METNKKTEDDNITNELMDKFLDDFMSNMYPKKDHIIARKYFRELFQKLIPKYFCVCETKK